MTLLEMTDTNLSRDLRVAIDYAIADGVAKRDTEALLLFPPLLQREMLNKEVDVVSAIAKLGYEVKSNNTNKGKWNGWALGNGTLENPIPSKYTGRDVNRTEVVKTEVNSLNFRLWVILPNT